MFAEFPNQSPQLTMFSAFEKTFKFNGKKRVDHEESHGLHNITHLETREKDDSQDDVYNYQCSLLEYEGI